MKTGNSNYIENKKLESLDVAIEELNVLKASVANGDTKLESVRSEISQYANDEAAYYEVRIDFG